MRKYLLVIIALLLCVPAFFKMLRPGIYSMQDFHYFRLVEFDKCVRDLQIPCRWSSDAGLGYGEPLFNFYGQGGYIIGEVFHLFELPFTDSLKLSFIFSFVASAVGMYFLSKKIWKNNWAALVSAVFYVYAPYRAVDVWVRGALPEAMSFVFFPIIILLFEYYLETTKRKYLVLFALSFAFLIITHNLSVILFLPFLGLWVPYRIFSKKRIKLLPYLGIGIALALFLSAFYLLPVIFESKFIDLGITTRGYFDYRGHFAGVGQLLLSRYWGYGGSVFGPEDGLNLSVGLLQWSVPLFGVFIVLVTLKIKAFKDVFVLSGIGAVCLLLTHNLSTPIWISLDFMKYIQFPWRFLGVAVFALSLSSGGLIKVLDKQKIFISSLLIVLAILINTNFFREDIWYDLADVDLTTGVKWEEQTRASIGDYWPISAGPIVTNPAPTKTKDFELISKTSNQYVFAILSDRQDVKYPVNDFPGWSFRKSEYKAVFNFTNTPIRLVGNLISVVSLGLVGFLFYAK